MSGMRLVIAGSREFDDYHLLEAKLDAILSNSGMPDVVISGTARGADRLGERWAEARNITVERMPADWNKFGKRAGFLRNTEMAKTATHVVVFMVSGSRGAAMMADISQKRGLPTRVVTL
jgi:hypothetical protein